jgi:hypothetical protein
MPPPQAHVASRQTTHPRPRSWPHKSGCKRWPGTGKTKTGRLWTYVRDERRARFDRAVREFGVDPEAPDPSAWPDPFALERQLQSTGGRYALVTMCVGVGQGIAAMLERV